MLTIVAKMLRSSIDGKLASDISLGIRAVKKMITLRGALGS